MIRILLDQGLPRSTAEKLREKGWDVVHALDCGLSTAADARILEFAKNASRTICTLDGDFHALLAVSGASAPSVIRIRREGLRGSDLALILERIWGEVGGSLEAGALVSVTERAIRLRRLPIGSGTPPSPQRDAQ